MDLLTDVCADIADAHAKLGHTLGWRFLYTPARTLTSDAPLLFLALNPGGKTDEPETPRCSVEGGNAYRVEQWDPRGGPNGLEKQVCKLYGLIAQQLWPTSDTALRRAYRDSLMDSAISANFCPFRSQPWSCLPNRAKSVEFSKSLWSRILREITPPAVVCTAHIPAQYIARTLRDLGWTGEEPRALPTGWGNTTCSISRLKHGDRETVVVRLPHLSRYGIVGKPKYESAVTQIVTAIADSIRLRQAS